MHRGCTCSGGNRIHLAPGSWCREAGVPLVVDHTSGHAPVVDFQRIVAALQPVRLVPIHTEAAESYQEYVPHVEMHCDGEWWDVGEPWS